jgi:phosphoesterase RecJ-like protein
MIITTLDSLKTELMTSLAKYDSVGIVTHQNPDGDGLPACIALKILLENSGHHSTIVLEESAPETFTFIQAHDYTSVVSDDMQFDILLLVDCHEQKRIGKCGFLVDVAKNVITIDHHPPGDLIEKAQSYFDVNIVCAGATIYQLFSDEMKRLPSKKQTFLANVFYTTVLNDTDQFMNANVDAFTYQFCSELMNYGLNPGDITQEFLYKKKPLEMRFIGEVLATIDVRDDKKILFMHSTMEMLERNNLTDAATSKLTRWVKGVDNVKVVVYVREMEQNKYRLSLRSNFINVNKIAVKYNGGGHVKASGCEIDGSLVEIKEKIIQDIREQM